MNLNHPIVTASLASALLVVGYASPAHAQVNRRPAAPSALAAAAGQDGRVSLNWLDNSSNETGFKITRTPAFPGGDKVVSSNTKTFVDQPGAGRFRYRVSAINSVGSSRWTAASAVTVEPLAGGASNLTSTGSGTDSTVAGSGQVVILAIPNMPSNLIATPGTGQVALEWRDNSNNEFFFEIEKQKLVGTAWEANEPIIRFNNAVSHVDLVSNATYRYRVRAGQWGGMSDYTGWAQVTVGGAPATVPNSPSAIQTSDAGSGRAMVSWTDNSSNETSFQLERNPAFASGTMAINANVTSFIDQTGNGTFSYRVSAANGVGASNPTGWSQVVVTSGSTGGSGGGGGGGGGGTGGGAGWTDLTPPAGAQVFYVSSSGADSNPGTQAAPFRSLSRGYQALRDGQPDQLLLKCGDTWNESFPSTFSKGAGSTSSYMVLGSYGTGARPKIRVNQPVVYGGTAGKKGLAIVGLDMATNSPGAGFAAITFFQGWEHILVEDCSIIGFPVNIVCQEVSSGRLNDLKIRRNIIADSKDTGSGHSQGIFMGCTDNWVIEGNVLDNNARDKADMFCHNVYLHETNGPGIFKDNISARACSHGVQQRPGGNMENNLFLQNPINAYQGKSASSNPAAVNYFRYNVALDSRDINGIDRRGVGFVIGGADTTIVEYNVVAHQASGTDAVTAFNFDNVKAATIRGNYVFDWTYNGAGWGTAYQWDGGGSSGAILFENNKAFQPNHGMAIRHEGHTLGSSFTYRNNSYYSTNPATGYEQFSRGAGQGGGWSWWQQQAGETGSTFSNPGTVDVKIGTYLQSIGMSGSAPEFLAQARLQSKSNWRTQYTSDAANDWVRTRLGLTANP